VSLQSDARNITVTDCNCFDAKSIITGGRRYSFNNSGQMNLIMNCHTTEGRHDFVTGARTRGPNVFYNCTSSTTHADIGPHHRQQDIGKSFHVYQVVPAWVSTCAFF
jgi:hypothetical protein